MSSADNSASARPRPGTRRAGGPPRTPIAAARDLRFVPGLRRLRRGAGRLCDAADERHRAAAFSGSHGDDAEADVLVAALGLEALADGGATGPAGVGVAA